LDGFFFPEAVFAPPPPPLPPLFFSSSFPAPRLGSSSPLASPGQFAARITRSAARVDEASTSLGDDMRRLETGTSASVSRERKRVAPTVRAAGQICLTRDSTTVPRKLRLCVELGDHPGETRVSIAPDSVAENIAVARASRVRRAVRRAPPRRLPSSLFAFQWGWTFLLTLRR
jgi:hypothetical protein